MLLLRDGVRPSEFMLTMTIYPYLFDDTCWVFDDEKTGLKEEAFVLGMSEMISRVVDIKKIPRAANGFAMTFGAMPFDHDVELNWVSHDSVPALSEEQYAALPGLGNWYRADVFGREMLGWLCPALFCYFPEAPKQIFVKVEPLPAGVNPIWKIDPNDPRANRFVSPGELPGE